MPIFTFHGRLPQQLRIAATTSGLRDLAPLVALRHLTGSMVAYLVACHRGMSVLTLPLNPDIYRLEAEGIYSHGSFT